MNATQVWFYIVILLGAARPAIPADFAPVNKRTSLVVVALPEQPNTRLATNAAILCVRVHQGVCVPCLMAHSSCFLLLPPACRQAAAIV
jgi:hypothetical protein